ncbi:MAG: hypothetical protein ACLFPD_11565 [Desulfosudaceae bacterium]
MNIFQQLQRLETVMLAVTFAEANEHDTARRILRESRPVRQRSRARKTTENRVDNRPQLRL